MVHLLILWSFTVFGKPEPKKEDEDTFIKRIRQEIETNTCQTSGICVFEHEDDSNLDDYEQKVLDNLRKAHESWTEKNPKLKKVTGKDVYHSVKIRVS